MDNAHQQTVEGFGDEWKRFSQEALSEQELASLFDDYFRIFPWSALPANAKGADFGCGSGRWAKLVAPRVGHLTLVDASGEALAVARRNTQAFSNVTYLESSLTEAAIDDESLDFAYSLGVLHHMPDTEGALRSIAKKLKPGAVALIYLYYAFDQKPLWFRGLWKASDVLRKRISKLPMGARYAVSQVIAGTVYWPLARTAWLLDKAGKLPANWPLLVYRERSFYTMRTDALDRFGTQLEQRFTREQMTQMFLRSGFNAPTFSDGTPYWVAVATKR